MSQASQHVNKLCSGTWDDNLSWNFYLDDHVPDISLCFVVCCLAFTKQTNEIVLTRNNRDWEMLGGHIEPDETIHNALVREALEEGGFHVQKYIQFGFMEVSAKKSVINEHHGGTYPRQTYTPFFIGMTDEPLVHPSGEETFEADTFSIDQAVRLLPQYERILRVGMEIYQENKDRI